MTLPNFLIIGVAKSGTTSLYHYLKEHPQIFMSPVKEARFFAFEKDLFEKEKDDEELPKVKDRFKFTTIEQYSKLFQKVSNEKAIGEASPVYLFSSTAPELIHSYIPNVKVIAILRDPVERAYSAYQMRFRKAYETCDDFMKAFQKIRKIPIGGNYKNKGLYYKQLMRYYKLFNAEQIKIYLYEDLRDKPQKLMKDIFQFLGVDENFVPDLSVKYNVGWKSTNKKLDSLVINDYYLKTLIKRFIPQSIISRLKNNFFITQKKAKPKLSKELRKELIEVYRDDILKLEDLINRDLSMWLKA
ncbi:Sulfotransferase family protein [Candidatus Magnetomoraceae bacterium gMMP-15]